MDGALANIDVKASEWCDVMDGFREDDSKNPEMSGSAGKLFQYDETTDITDTDCGQLWNFSDFDNGNWGSPVGNSGGDNAQWSDFFA